MALNYIWVGLFIVGFIVGIFQFLYSGNPEVIINMMKSTFDSSKDGFYIALNLTGALALWLGLMKIAEKSNLITLLAKFLKPFLVRIFPSLPKEHPVHGEIVMNISANMLGLDNAATPLGLKAMKSMQDLNTEKEKASDAQIMFLTLNASGLTIIPVGIMAVRHANGASNPADVFLPVLIATFGSTLAGLVAVSIYQKINLFKPIVFAYLGGMSLLITSFVLFFYNLSADKIGPYSEAFSAILILSIIAFFILFGIYKKVNVYDTFIEGAKEGFQTAITIIPYLVAILVSVTIFRNSGTMDLLLNGIGAFINTYGLNADFLPAIPTALMKPLSGSGARGMMVETMITYGPDSFASKLAGVFQGAADTTFYILSVYFGLVGIKNTRYTLTTCLIADFVGVITGIIIAYLLF